MKRIEIAEHLGASRPSVNRFMKKHGLQSGQHTQYDKKIVEKICESHEKIGVKKTQEKYPDVNVRSITERYNSGGAFSKPWTDKQILLLVRYCDLIDLESLKRLLNRDFKCVGTLRRTTRGKLNIRLSQRTNLNGIAYRFIKSMTDEKIKIQSQDFGHKTNFCLWIDIKKNLISENEDIKKLVSSMAKFQRWLHGGNPIVNEKDIFDYELSQNTA